MFFNIFLFCLKGYSETLNWQFWYFGPNLFQKGYFQRKNEHHHWILHIRISLGIHISQWTNDHNFSDKIYSKRVFPVKNRKSEHHHWIQHIRISLGTKFQFKLTILMFSTKFSLKRYLRSKKENIEHHHWILEIRISFDTKFQLKLTIFGLKQKKKWKPWWNFVANFNFKLTILTFWTKFAQKR